MCVHDMDNCAYHPQEVTYEAAAASLVAAMARPGRVVHHVQAQPAHTFPVPSTDAFEAYRDLDDYVSADPAHRRQLPRLTYPHWAVTEQARVHYDTHVRWTSRNIYGEITDLGMMPKGHTPQAMASNGRW